MRYVLIFFSDFVVRVDFVCEDGSDAYGAGKLVFHEAVLVKKSGAAGVRADTGLAAVDDDGRFRFAFEFVVGP